MFFYGVKCIDLVSLVPCTHPRYNYFGADGEIKASGLGYMYIGVYLLWLHYMYIGKVYYPSKLAKYIGQLSLEATVRPTVRSSWLESRPLVCCRVKYIAPVSLAAPAGGRQDQGVLLSTPRREIPSYQPCGSVC